MKPAHAAPMSRAPALTAPIAPWTIQLTDGKGMSPVTVAQITRSISLGSNPRLARSVRTAWVDSVAVVSSGPAIRRSRIPVRCTIHSSEVSTIRSRSRFDRTASGTACAIPVTTALNVYLPTRTCAIRLLVRGFRFFGQILLHARSNRLDDFPFDRQLGPQQRVLDRLRRTPAMADRAQSVESKQRRTANLRVVHPLAQRLHDFAQRKVGELKHGMCRYLRPNRVDDQLGHPFARLEHHIADERVAYDHIALLEKHPLALDVSGEPRKLRQELMSLLGHCVALRLLLADVHQVHGRILAPHHLLGVGSPHQREFDQVLGIDIRARTRVDK